MEKEIWHWIKMEHYKMSQNGHDVNTACGQKIIPAMRFSTLGMLPVINCHDCKEAYRLFELTRKQKLCSFCPTPLSDIDYEDSNNFYLSCSQHKRLAQIETEKLFSTIRDYTKWSS
jgi:hypothetical protein